MMFSFSLPNCCAIYNLISHVMSNQRLPLAVLAAKVPCRNILRSKPISTFFARANMSGVSKLTAERNQRTLHDLLTKPGNGKISKHGG